MVPWADILYGCDKEWWCKHRGVPEFKGMRITQGDYAPPRGIVVRTVKIIRGDDVMRLDKFGHIGWGGNSGFQAINLAVQFGVSKIILVGFDMSIDGGIHWHGKHEYGLSNPTKSNTKGWRVRLDGVADSLSGAGVEVLNASPKSALTAYKKIDFASFFGEEEAT